MSPSMVSWPAFATTLLLSIVSPTSVTFPSVLGVPSLLSSYIYTYRYLGWHHTQKERTENYTARVAFRGSYSLLRSRLSLVWAKGYYGCEHKASAMNLTRERAFGFICTSTCRRSFPDLLWLCLWSYRNSQQACLNESSFRYTPSKFQKPHSIWFVPRLHIHRQTVSKCDYRLISAFPPEWQNVKIAYRSELV